MESILKVENLRKEFLHVTALEDINLEIPKGKIVGLLGPNGSGKTTFIKLLNKLLVPTNGSILIDGMEPGVETKKIVAYLPDKDYLNEWMKVRELVEFFDDFYDNFNKETAYDMLSNLNINGEMSLKSLSKGNREKVQLILTMSRDAKLFLLDEPIGGVDPAARDYILNTIINNYSEDATVIISTHLIADIESVLDEVIFIKNGNITLYGDADEIREKHNLSIDKLFREEFRC